MNVSRSRGRIRGLCVGRFSQWLICCGLLALAAFPAHANSLCDGIANNRLLNCGFELNSSGATSITDWTTFNFAPCCGSVTSGTVNSGGEALQIGDFDGTPLEGIAQTFADVSGQSYQVSFYVQYGLSSSTNDPSAFFQASIDGVVKTSLSGSPNPAFPFTQFQFSFIGTGSDTIRFDAQTNPSEWIMDDVSVVGPAPTGGTAPEPAAFALTALGLLSTLGLRRRRMESQH